METDTKTLMVGMLVIISLIGTTYIINNPDVTYYCEEKNAVAICDKLGALVNDSYTRCYYNSTKYFTCKTGWKNIREFPEIMKNFTIIGVENIEDVNLNNTDIINITKKIENRTFYIVEAYKYPGIPSEKIFKCEWKGEL